MTPIALTRLIRQDVIPLVVVDALFLCMLVAAWRRPQRRAAVPTPPRTGLVLYLLRTATAGYLVLLSILAVFYVGLGERGWPFFARAAGRSAVLTYGVVVPSFMGLSWLRGRPRRNRSRSLGIGS